jgi:hypothetical protein
MTHEFRIYQGAIPGCIENILNDKDLEHTLSIFKNPRNFYYANAIIATWADDKKSITIKITSDEQKEVVLTKLADYIANINT